MRCAAQETGDVTSARLRRPGITAHLLFRLVIVSYMELFQKRFFMSTYAGKATGYGGRRGS